MTDAALQPPRALGPVVAICRPGEWRKNVAYLAWGAYCGSGRAFVFDARWAVALAATCCLWSSFYILDDIADRPLDVADPSRAGRPLAGGRLSEPFAIALSASLCAGALAALLVLDLRLGAVGLVAGLLQGVHSARPGTKRIRFLDVAVAGFSFGAIRAMIGWLAVDASTLPPLAVLAVPAFYKAAAYLAYQRLSRSPFPARRREGTTVLLGDRGTEWVTAVLFVASVAMFLFYVVENAWPATPVCFFGLLFVSAFTWGWWRRARLPERQAGGVGLTRFPKSPAETS